MNLVWKEGYVKGRDNLRKNIIICRRWEESFEKWMKYMVFFYFMYVGFFLKFLYRIFYLIWFGYFLLFIDEELD